MSDSTPPLAVGLAGAGPWAANVLAPMLAAGPETRLAGVWTRRAEAASALAAAHGAQATPSFEALIECSDAIAFALPPDVQAELGIIAARAGRHLMLEKPLGITLASAEALASEVQRAGVVTQVMLTHRYRESVRAFLARAAAVPAIGARLAFLSGAFLRGPYANAWRREHGVLHDLGPHAFDLLQAAVGPIERIAGSGDPRRWVTLACTHAGGAVSEVTLSGVMTLPQTVFTLEVYGPEGALAFDAVAASKEDAWAPARRSFASAVRSGTPPALDVRHGLALQRTIEAARLAIGA